MGTKIKRFFKKIRIKRTTVLVLVFVFMSATLVRQLFELQIIQGEAYISKFESRTTKKRVIKSTRGNIYDRNGEELATNVLAYSVTFEDNGTYDSTREKNLTLNGIAYKVLKILESNGDSISTGFHIVLDESGNYAFDVDEGFTLNRFRADIYGEAQIDDQDEHEQHNAGGDQRLAVEVGGVAHLDDDVGGHRAQALEQALGHPCLVACDHNDRHRLTDGAADAEDDRRQHAGLGCGQHRAENAALMGGAQCQAALIVAVGNGVQARLADRDDGGQDHDAQQHSGGEKAHALAAFDVEHRLEEGRLDHGLHGGHQHDHAEEAVDDGGDAGEQLGAGLEQTVELFRAVVRHEDGGQQADGHADEDSPRRDVDAAQDHRQDAEDIVAWLPSGAQQELERADFEQSRHAVCKQEDADQRDRQNGYTGAECEHHLHDAFF